MGDHLKAIIKQAVTEELEIKKCDVQGHGKYMDSTDLEEKYKNKKEQLENIKNNANSFICPNREVQMYEDMDYTTGFKEEATHTNKRKLEVSTEDTIRGKPKPKTVTNGADAVPLAVMSNKMDEKQQTKLVGWLKHIEDWGAKLEQLKASIDELATFIAPATKINIDDLAENTRTRKVSATYSIRPESAMTSKVWIKSCWNSRNISLKPLPP